MLKRRLESLERAVAGGRGWGLLDPGGLSDDRIIAELSGILGVPVPAREPGDRRSHLDALADAAGIERGEFSRLLDVEARDFEAKHEFRHVGGQTFVRAKKIV